MLATIVSEYLRNNFKNLKFPTNLPLFCRKEGRTHGGFERGEDGKEGGRERGRKK